MPFSKGAMCICARVLLMYTRVDGGGTSSNFDKIGSSFAYSPMVKTLFKKQQKRLWVRCSCHTYQHNP